MLRLIAGLLLSSVCSSCGVGSAARLVGLDRRAAMSEIWDLHY